MELNFQLHIVFCDHDLPIPTILHVAGFSSCQVQKFIRQFL